MALALLLALLTGAGPAAVAADEPSDEQLRSELERVQNEREGLSGDLSDVETRQQELSVHLQAATDRVAELDAELGRLHNETDALTAEVAGLEALMAESAEGLRSRVRDLYKDAGGQPLLDLVVAGSAADVTRRSHYMLALSRDDQAELETAAGIERILARRRAELDASTAATRNVAAQAAEARAELDSRLTEAGELAASVRGEIVARDAEGQALSSELDERQREREEAARRERERQAEQERQRELAEAERRRQQEAAAIPAAAPGEPAPAPAPSGGGMACPQDHPRSFSDTWGAPRSGGRSHRGTDIFGVRGGLVFAITDGVVQSTSNGALSGLFLSLRGDDGHTYWYMHLQDFAAQAGQRVSAGEVIAHNGDTGNARGTTPHIHFEYHPGGGGAINPYPLLRQVCG